MPRSAAKSAPLSASSTARPPRQDRAQKSAARREAILAAALDEFSARGFEGARLDDVARCAGVAKGTIYLHFRDKEALFQELVRSVLNPLVAALEAVPQADLPVRVTVERITDLFVREVYGTRRKDVIRLILNEGPRFPALAEFYYREVVARILAAIRGLMRRAIERGELTSDVFIRFPQLLVAPGIVAILWNSLFHDHEPLDVAALMRAHVDLLFGGGKTK
jgi:AcrR family transcriptional regulator